MALASSPDRHLHRHAQHAEHSRRAPSAGTATITGVSSGIATLTGTATGYITGSLSVDVQNRNISIPTALNVPYGQSGVSLPIQIPAPRPRAA